MFNVYSLRDIEAVIECKGVGQCVLSASGTGRIGYSFSGDMSTNTKTANGYVTLNRIRVTDGVINVEVPMNSEADLWFRRWINYLDDDNTKTMVYGNTTLTIRDPFGKINAEKNGMNFDPPIRNREIEFLGVAPQKRPDASYDQTAANVQYNLLFAEIKK